MTHPFPLPVDAVLTPPSHRDMRAAVFAALPPRRAPLAKRVFWWAVLGLARFAVGRKLLLALRGR